MIAFVCPGATPGVEASWQGAMRARRGDCLDNPTDPGWCVWCGQPTTRHWLAQRAIARLTTVVDPFRVINAY